MMLTLPICSVPSARAWALLPVLLLRAALGVREVQAGQVSLVAAGELPCRGRPAYVEEVKVRPDTGLPRSSVLYTRAVVSLNILPYPSSGCWVIPDNDIGNLE